MRSLVLSSPPTLARDLSKTGQITFFDDRAVHENTTRATLLKGLQVTRAWRLGRQTALSSVMFFGDPRDEWIQRPLVRGEMIQSQAFVFLTPTSILRPAH
jgi:hypothetical protein